MARYAEKTRVSISSSMEEIQRRLTKAGARNFGVQWPDDGARIGWLFGNLRIVIEVDYPPRGDFRGDDAHEQACRQRWRALLLLVKSKIECVELGITTIEEEFMPFVLTDAGPLGKVLMPHLQQKALGGAPIRMLPLLEADTA